MNGTLTDILGIEVGHFTDLENGTGCTVILTRAGAVGGVDVRGAAPGTRETDLLRAENAVSNIHGILLSGGSAYGLAAAGGVMRYLEEQGSGHRVGEFIVPIVPGAIIFDLGIGKSAFRPTEAEGYAASSIASSAQVEQGTVGAVHDPDSGELLAGPRDSSGRPRSSVEIYSDPAYGFRSWSFAGEPAGPQHLGNTTIAVIATSAGLTKPQANRLATVAHDGLALAIRPTHTVHDGDTVFAVATGAVDAPDEYPRLCALAPTVMAQAIVNAVRRATGLYGIPSLSEVSANG